MKIVMIIMLCVLHYEYGNTMSLAFVNELYKPEPKLVSVSQWLTLNMPVSETNYKTLMDHATTIAHSPNQLESEDVVTKLFALQEQQYHAQFDGLFKKNIWTVRGSNACAFIAISISVLLGGLGLQCGLS